MESIFAYQSYRTFLRDYYAKRHAYGFTWRDFSAKCGYSSPVFLKLVSEGKGNLSPLGTERVASALGLTGKELEFFRLLVNFEQEKSPKKRETLFAEIRQMALENKVKIAGEEQYDYFSSWRNPVVREILRNLGEQKLSEVAGLFLEKTSAQDVRKAVSVLERVGFLKKSGAGYEVSEAVISTGALEPGKLAVRQMHKQMGELAVKSLDEVDPRARDISGMTLGLSENAFARVSEELAAFRRRVAAIALEDSGKESVYRLNLQLFPLTKPFGGET